jgi:hypothetical protein
MQVWPTLTSHIPSPDTVLRLAAAPNFDPSCTREEWGLIALVDGNRSVSEIVALLGRSEFAVAGALAALVERGLLTVDTTGSGLADLQRRQAIIAGLEAGEGGSRPAIPAPTHPAGETPAAPHAPVAAAVDVPMARSAGSDFSMGSNSYVNAGAESYPYSPTAHSPGPVIAPALAYDRPMTDGSAALDVAPAVTEPVPGGREPVARGLDSAVTKSLVLRLIAGVRGL